MQTVLNAARSLPQEENSMDDALEKRLIELSRRAFQQGCYCFTHFLDLAALNAFSRLLPSLPPVPWRLFGGVEGCERKILRLGDADFCGYEMPFPIVCLHIKPLNERFAEPLTHRDYLGALMALGIERELLGDIVTREKEAFLFCEEHIAPYLAEHFTQARRTSLCCQAVDTPPAGELFKTERRLAQLSSERLDALIAHIFKLPRGDAQALFPQWKIFVDGRQCESASYAPKPGEIISVRGQGRMRYVGMESLSKKGKCNVAVELYI